MIVCQIIDLLRTEQSAFRCPPVTTVSSSRRVTDTYRFYPFSHAIGPARKRMTACRKKKPKGVLIKQK